MFKFIEIESACKGDVLELLEKNVLGTPGKSMRYRHSSVREKIHHLVRPHFVNIRKGNAVIGTCCFCERETFTDEELFLSFYIRFFSFKEQYRRKSGAEVSSKFNGKLKSEIKELLNGSGLLNNNKIPAFFYAYVDPNNERSARLCRELGFVQLREFSTLTFSRFYPRQHPQVSRISSEEKPTVYNLIKEQYSGYSMFSDENLFYKDNYFLLKNKEGEILAGVQANVENWKIVEMPGLMGKLILNSAPYVPLLNKLFNSDFKFASLEAITFKAGYEDQLPILFEAVLANLSISSALTWVDCDSDLYQVLKRLDLGFLHMANKEVKAGVVGKFMNIGDAQIHKIKTSATYISAFDLT